MKRYYVTLAIILSSALSTQILAQEQILTEEGFPYKQVIKRAKQIKLIYQVNSDEVYCRAQVDLGDQIIESEQRKAGKWTFDRAPLKACLGRDKAKQILKLL